MEKSEKVEKSGRGLENENEKRGREKDDEGSIPKAKKKKGGREEDDEDSAPKAKKKRSSCADGVDDNDVGPVKENKRRKKSEEKEEVSTRLRCFSVLASSSLLFYTPGCFAGGPAGTWGQA